MQTILFERKEKNTYNELNQLVAEDDTIYTYDDAGNLIAGSRNNILLFSYEYNSRNQLIKSLVYTVEGILTVEYEYNYLGDRISKTVDGEKTSYTLEYSSGLSQVIEEVTNSKTVFYVRGLELISREEELGKTYFYVLDGGNTVRDLVDEDGNVTDKYIFDSFGNEISHEGDSNNSYGFQGEQLDEETGLYYLRARYMNFSTGTFTSMDTYGGSLFYPTSLHKYLFANSNPVKYCDPTGHFSMEELEAVISIDNILMSAVMNEFAFCGMAGNDPSVSMGEGLAGSVCAFLIGLIVPVLIGMLMVSCSLLCCVVVLGEVAVGFGLFSWFLAREGNTVEAILCGLVANEAFAGIINIAVDIAVSKVLSKKIFPSGYDNLDDLHRRATEWAEFQHALDTDNEMNTVSVAYNTVTGEYFYGVNGGISNPNCINPELNMYLPATSTTNWTTYNCAEVNAVNNAMNNGSFMGDLQLYTINTHNNLPKPMCSNCEQTFGYGRILYSEKIN